MSLFSERKTHFCTKRKSQNSIKPLKLVFGLETDLLLSPKYFIVVTVV